MDVERERSRIRNSRRCPNRPLHRPHEARLTANGFSIAQGAIAACSTWSGSTPRTLNPSASS